MQEQECQNESPKQEFRLRPYQDEAAQWAIDNGSGIIVAPAGSGKTWIAASIVKRFLAQREYYKIGWLAPTRETCHQAQASLEVAGVNMANVTIRCPHESVDFHNIDLLIVDECKHSPAESWKRIIENCDGVRFGFDATPWCDDPDRNNVTRSLFRNKVYEIKREDLVNVLAHATVFMSSATDFMIQRKIDDRIEKLFTDRKRYMRIREAELRAMCAWEAITEIGICENNRRNDAAITFAGHCGNSPTLVLVPRVTLGERYAILLRGSVLVHSKMPKKARREAMEEFKAGNIRVMVATSLADEGLDLPNVETLVMVSGGRSAQKTIQRASRALRRAPGKEEAFIHDFKDMFHPLAQAHSKKRLKCYQQLGCTIE